MKQQTRRYCLAATLIIAAMAVMAGAPATASEIRSDEQVIFFPTLGRLSTAGKEWILPIHGWIFEPEEEDLFRRASLDWAAEALELPEGSATEQIFQERVRWFLVDDERGKQITIEIAGVVHALPRSTPDGHFVGELRLPVELVAAHAVDGRLAFRAQVNEGDLREFAGHIHLLEPAGAIVISDIDDTIKITEVTSHERLLKRTFLEPFEAVPGMAEVYRRWSDEGAAIHLLSNGPWQLYSDLDELLESESFPNATWSMRRFRLMDRTGVRFLLGGGNHKLEEIQRSLEWYPERTFILVGDTGERDPEIYGEIARQHPDRVQLVLLRNVTNETPDSQRLQDALTDVPADRWRLFTDAAELEEISTRPAEQIQEQPR
jgi:phosphatidate phosphatase APP1